jgi:hypothetical protein
MTLLLLVDTIIGPCYWSGKVTQLSREVTIFESSSIVTRYESTVPSDGCTSHSMIDGPHSYFDLFDFVVNNTL